MSRLVLYLGGPEAEAGQKYWLAMSDKGYLCCACDVADMAGFVIPRDTYHEADPAVSQDPRGWNYTAILPLEVD